MREQRKKTGLGFLWCRKCRNGMKLPACGFNILPVPKKWILELSYQFTQMWAEGGAFQVMLVVKILPANAGDIRDMGSIPGSGRYLGGRYGNPLQYSCLEKPMDRGVWQATVHRVAQSHTWLSNLLLIHAPYDQAVFWADIKKNWKKDLK